MKQLCEDSFGELGSGTTVITKLWSAKKEAVQGLNSICLAAQLSGQAVYSPICLRNLPPPFTNCLIGLVPAKHSFPLTVNIFAWF